MDDTNGVEDVFVHDTQTGTTKRVSVSTTGVEGNAGSWRTAISGNGRYVAFESEATNLTEDSFNSGGIFVHNLETGKTERITSSGGSPSISMDGRYVAFHSDSNNLVDNDNNELLDVFVYDRLLGKTERVSISSSGVEGNGHSWMPSISFDGRYVTFESVANNLVDIDISTYSSDIFVFDRQTGKTSLVSISSTGEQGNEDSRNPFISGDGRFVTFVSFASNLVDNDDNGQADIFHYDIMTGITKRVNVSSTGMQANSGSNYPSISVDGRYVVFHSWASNIIPNDTNDTRDVFVHDTWSGETQRVSISSTGEQGDLSSGYASISADGRYIAFRSEATNLVEGDTNGFDDIFIHNRGVNDLISPVTTASPAGGTYNSTQTVTLTADEPADIYYTVDGSDPTTASTLYTGPITINSTTTLKFMAVDRAGNKSTISTTNYTIQYPTQLAYTGLLSAAKDSTVTLSANLTAANGGPSDLSGREIIFTLGSQTVSAFTDAAGNATAALTLNQAAGNYPLTVTYNGDAALLGSTYTGTFYLTNGNSNNVKPNVAMDPIVVTPDANGQTYTATITGTVDQGAAVEVSVSINHGTPVVYQAVVNGTTWSYTIANLAKNDQVKIEAIAKDTVGNTSLPAKDNFKVR